MLLPLLANKPSFLSNSVKAASSALEYGFRRGSGIHFLRFSGWKVARIAWKADWAKRFLDAYQSIRPLTAAERAFLPHAALFNMIEYIQDWDTHTLIEDNCLRYRILKEQVKLLLK